MSKRDSVAAHLPSLSLMAEEMQIDLRHGPSDAAASSDPPAYAMATPTLPGPSSSTGYGIPPQADPRDLPFIMGSQPPLQPMERRTQTVHTIKFQRIRHGDAPTELKIEETDVAGFSKIKTLEHHFFGILSHCSTYSNGETRCGWPTTGVASSMWMKSMMNSRAQRTIPILRHLLIGHQCQIP